MSVKLHKFLDKMIYLLTYMSKYTHDNFLQRYKPPAVQEHLYNIYEDGDVLICTYLSPSEYNVQNLMVFYKYENIFRITFRNGIMSNYSSTCTEYTNISSMDKEFKPVPKGEGKKLVTYIGIDKNKLPDFINMDEDEYFQYSVMYDLPKFETIPKLIELFKHVKKIEIDNKFKSLDVFIQNDIFETIELDVFNNFSVANNKIMMDLLEDAFSGFKREYLK